MRSRLALLPLLFLCVVAAAPPVASAPADLHIVDARASAVFPLSLEFSIEAESSSPIVDARLLYQVDKMNYAPVTSEAWPVVVPSTMLATSWTWDMRRASLPPGATITYWWRLRDESGAVVESDPHILTFDDNRHPWQETGSSSVSLRWYEGDEAFAAQMLDICDTAVEDLARDVGTRVDRQIKVYIYASSEDMRQAMVYPQEWTGGVAFTDYGIVAIGIGPGDMDWGVRALRHELTHLVIHAATFSPFGVLPTWVDEGLAMHNEGDVDPNFERLLLQAAEYEALLSLRTLTGPFSSDTGRAYLSYAESQSVVEYLLDTYGSEAVHALLMAFRDGAVMDDALMLSFGLGLDELESDWHASLREQVANA
ncbi:MAG: peptidase MA family metallohydrolase [Dehalococcoidia bacterium]|jgi:hypothetical protein|nr:peptidase MA family metallohydrolase [Dehalococcoidia bacterium]